jgi:hypothetical protein
MAGTYHRWRFGDDNNAGLVDSGCESEPVHHRVAVDRDDADSGRQVRSGSANDSATLSDGNNFDGLARSRSPSYGPNEL